MVRKDIIDAIAEGAGLPKNAASDALDAFVNFVYKNMREGKKVKINGFGCFSVKHRGSRIGINPRNPTEKIKIPPKSRAHFKAGKTMKDAINS